MGRVKAEMQEAEERGWYALDTHVCADCVGDEYLKSLIDNNCEADICDYCGRASDKPIAAPTEVIQEAIASAVYYYFNEPTDAGVPWDEGPLIDPMDTDDVLDEVSLSCHQNLIDDIVDSFGNSAWVPAAGGHWASLHPHQELSYSWAGFVHAVKHETRYFFTTLESEEPGEYSSLALLNKIGELVPSLYQGRTDMHALRHLLQTHSSAYRDGPLEGVVVRREDDDWLLSRAKLVRAEFTQHIETHWRRQVLTWNRVQTSHIANDLSG